MTYPYPALTPQLQFQCSVEEYKKILEPYWTGTHKPDKKQLKPAVLKDPAYQAVIPYYTFARCPICGQIYREQGDTYLNISWGGTRTLRDTFYFPANIISHPPRCSHWMGIHQIASLHGIYPETDERYTNLTGEIPYVTDFYFTEDIATYIVLHGLPICSIQNNEFVPTHTAFTLTYFSENPQEVRQRYYKEAFYDDFPAEVHSPGNGIKPINYDLAVWTERGLLGWMDWTMPDIPLRLGKGEQLPEVFRNIQGERCPYDWSIYSPKIKRHCM